MKFHRPLQKAVFLSRKSDSIIEADVNTVKTALYCPNDSSLERCAILGSNIWFSLPVYTPYYIPATWQLSEIDLGDLVLINEQLCYELFLEGLKTGVIKFDNFNKIMINAELSMNYKYDYMLLNNTGDNKGDDRGLYVNIFTSSDREFPEAGYSGDDTDNIEGKQKLYDLIHAKMLGHRAAMCCFSLNQGVNQLVLTDKNDGEYASLLSTALKQGVEFYAYSLNISDAEVKVSRAIAIK